MRLLTTMQSLVLATLVAVSTVTPGATAQDQTLFERLGGQPAIEAVVDQFLMNVAGDARINRFFANADALRLRGLLVEQICAATGGPCVYTGRSMREVHAGLGVTEADFTALVEDLSAALDTFQVPAPEKGELLGLLAPMQSDIVQVPALVPAAPVPAVPVADPPVPAVPVPAVPVPAVPVADPPLPSAPVPAVPVAEPPVPGAPVPAVPVPAAPAPAAPAPAAVTIQSFAFNPPSVQVAVGGTVTWTNRDSVSHTATGSDFNTGLLTSGQSRSVTFASAGRFSYQCSIHNSMRGEVVVQ